MPAAAYLYVDRPVAALQFDLETAGQAVSMLDPALGKSLVSARQPDGRLRVIIYGLNRETFQGRFASVDQAVTGIVNVKGSDPDGADAGAVVAQIPRAGAPVVVLLLQE